MDPRAAEAYILDRLRTGLPAHRTYHSYEHTLDVHRTTVTIAGAEGIWGEDLDILTTAALYHDCGFLIQDHEHEEGSCKLAHQTLPGFGYTEQAIIRICTMIRSTKIPQDPQDDLSRILCDADLDYLGRPDFFTIGATLFSEFKHHGVVTTERDWNELQARFLRKHRYFTSRSKLVREPAKLRHLTVIEDWLRTDRQVKAQ